jgi:ribosomal protein S27AE
VTPKTEGQVCLICGNLVYVIDEAGNQACGSCGWVRLKGQLA